MAEGQSPRSLEFQIFNKTQNITLKYHRLEKDQGSPHLNPELPPGSSDSCRILSDPQAPDFRWFLVYEAESFTLAILVFVPLKPGLSPNVLHLELSLDKTHLGDLDRTLSRMMWTQDPPDADRSAVCQCLFSNGSEGFVRISAGPYKVMALVSRHPRPLLKVELEERGRSKDGLVGLELPRCGIL